MRSILSLRQLGRQRTCDDEAQRVRGIAIYNKSDGLATVEIDNPIFWIFSHARHSQKRANAENHCTKGGSDGKNVVDCREYPSEMNCTVAISADTKEELVDAAVQHAVAVHGHHDSPQLRQELAKMIKTQ